MAKGLERDLIAYLDTHVRYGCAFPTASREIELNEFLTSSMVMLDFQYLCEWKRLKVRPLPRYAILNSSLGTDRSGFPFDRIIVAQAIVNHDAPLITADEKIRRHYPNAVW